MDAEKLMARFWHDETGWDIRYYDSREIRTKEMAYMSGMGYPVQFFMLPFGWSSYSVWPSRMDVYCEKKAKDICEAFQAATPKGVWRYESLSYEVLFFLDINDKTYGIRFGLAEFRAGDIMEDIAMAIYRRIYRHGLLTACPTRQG